MSLRWLTAILDRLLPVDLATAAGEGRDPETLERWQRARVMQIAALAALTLMVPTTFVSLSDSSSNWLTMAIFGWAYFMLTLPLTLRWHRLPLEACARATTLALALVIILFTHGNGILRNTSLLWLPALVAAAFYLTSRRFAIGLTIALAGTNAVVYLLWLFDVVGPTMPPPNEYLYNTLLDSSSALLFTGVLSHFNDRARRAMHARMQGVDRELDRQRAAVASSAKMAALGEMAAGLAHEVNNPLTSIKLWARWAKGSGNAKTAPSPAELDAAFAKIDANIERIATIVRAMRQFARDPGKETPQRCDLRALTEDVVLLLSERLRERKIDVMLELEPGLVVFGRHGQLAQVLHNLMVNAMHSVEVAAGLRWIRLAATRRGKTICLRIEDSGAGVRPEHRDKLFQPFFTTREVGQGMGLGLTLSLGIVESHGGSLYHDEAAPHCCFVAELPAAQAAQTPTTAA